MRNVLIVLILTALATPSSGMTFVTLDKDGQGKGNKGTNFRPVDAMGDLANFELTARSSVDTLQPSVADAPGPFGTVFVDDDGTGVQNASAGASKGISGKGADDDEELIFSYDNPVPLDLIMLGLVD